MFVPGLDFLSMVSYRTTCRGWVLEELFFNAFAPSLMGRLNPWSRVEDIGSVASDLQFSSSHLLFNFCV